MSIQLGRYSAPQSTSKEASSRKQEAVRIQITRALLWPIALVGYAAVSAFNRLEESLPAEQSPFREETSHGTYWRHP